MLIPRRTQRGVTLVELMIASVIGLITLAALATTYGATAGHSTRYLHRAHLHQQLHSVLQIVVSDIRRAGYWNFDPTLRSAADNPFADSTNRLRTGSYPGEASHSCVVFAYDLDQDGLVGVGNCKTKTCGAQTDSDNVEQFGYRLRDGRIQARYGGDALGCDSGHWQALTDPNIEIGELVFSEYSACVNLYAADADCAPHAPSLIQRSVEIQLSGQTRGSPETSLRLSSMVRIRNDRIVAEQTDAP